MKFGSQADDVQDSRSQRTPPPDYSSRKVQLRLLVIVALGMALLLSFQWIWGLVSPPAREVPLPIQQDLAGAEPESFGREPETGDIRAASLVQARADLAAATAASAAAERETTQLRTELSAATARASELEAAAQTASRDREREKRSKFGNAPRTSTKVVKLICIYLHFTLSLYHFIAINKIIVTIK